MTHETHGIEPVELMPRQQWLAIRFIAVRSAVLGKRRKRETVPAEWLDEFFDLSLDVLIVRDEDGLPTIATGLDE
jgi:hypothetical protein